MNRTEYQNKMTSLLNDTKTYARITSNPLSSLQNKNNTYVAELIRHEAITPAEAKRLSSHNGTYGKCYGLVKNHKENNPLRLLITACGTPTYRLSQYISKILKPIVDTSPYHIKNSFTLARTLRDLDVVRDDDISLVSMDIQSMFNNIPVDLTISYINFRFNDLNSPIDKTLLINIILFILKSAFFTYNNLIYKQTFGVPQGLPLSGTIADIFMIKLENEVMSSLNLPPLFYGRYVDDTIILADNTTINHIFNSFNSFHPRVIFTIEYSENNSINFLDVTITFTNNAKISLNWYHKKTWTARYISYHSFTSFKYKKNINL